MESNPESLYQSENLDLTGITQEFEEASLANVQAQRKQVEQDVLTLANRIKLLQAED